MPIIRKITACNAMASRRYPSVDISGHTHPSNYGVRAMRPIGTGVHTTGSANSIPFLQSDRRATSGISGADYLISREGDRHQLTPSGKFAYHFGKARWNYLSNDGDLLSKMYIGVELENLNDQMCTWMQMDSLAELIVSVLAPMYSWAFPFDIVGHYEVAVPIGRRSDPLGFNWGQFMGFLYARAKEAKFI